MSPDQAGETTAGRGPLAGIRVVELANFLAGPMAGMLLGDFGADVVKVERPDGGDESRLWGHHKDGVGLYFKVLNRNKRSVTADLRSGLGAEIVKRLVAGADVVIENFRPGTLERWGIGYDVLRAVNPDLVMLSVTAYGQTGPFRDRPGFGTIAEAFAGYAAITGERDGPPLLPAFGLADATTGLTGAFLVMVALRARDQGAGGQRIDLAIYEPLLTLLGPQVVDYDVLGVVQQRNGSRLPFTAPRNTFRTRDGSWVAVGGSAQSVFERICQALEVPHLVDEPMFKDNRARVANAARLDEALQAAIARFDLDELLARCESHEAAVAPVQDVAAVVAHAQVLARGNIVEIDDSELGPMRMQDVVGRLSGTPGHIVQAGPKHGADNRDILVGQLGFDPTVLAGGGIVC